MSAPQIQVSDLNALWAAIGSLREARALLSNRVRGTNDILYGLCQEYERTVKEAESAYNRIRQFYANSK